MTTEQWERLKDIFTNAVERPREERDAFAKRACAAYPDLLVEVQRLLAEYERESSSLSRPALGSTEQGALEQPPCFSPGMILAGRFRIVRFIARGGMGEVYEAEDLELGEHVALKTIRPEIAGDERALALFKTETQLARRVTHPNVCRIYDLAQHLEPALGGGQITHFLSMELLHGETLAHHLRACGSLTPAAALPLIRQMTSALQAAHDAGVIHRDLKPGNVMLSPGSGSSSLRVVVTDFGLALPAIRAKQESSTSDRGTPHFMAPEQRDGRPITPATDVYSLALVIASMLGARRSPSEVSRLQALLRPAGSQPEEAALNLPSSAARWERVLKRCLRRNPAERYSRPADVADALRAPLIHRSRLVPAIATLLSIGITLAIVLFLFTGWERASAPGTMRPIWTGDDVDTYGRVSPDGRFLSFIDWSTGDLAIRNVVTGEKYHVTQKPKNLAGGAGGSLFSPDSHRLAYIWREEDGWPEIRIIRANGSEVRTVFRVEQNTDSLLVADWSPDGKQVLAVLGGRQANAELLLINLADASVRSVPCMGRFRLDIQALFSPDGRYVVYDAVNTTPSGDVIRQVELATLHDSILLQGSASNHLLAWSQDGTRILFASDRSGTPGLWSLPITDGQARGDPEPLKLSTGGWISPLGITRRGALFYSVAANTSEVYVTELDPVSGVVVSSPRPLGQRYIQSKGSMVWSPDGSSLLFVTSRGRRAGILVIHSMTDDSERELYPELLNLSLVHKWHPDGASVFADGTTFDHVSGLFQVSLATGQVRVAAVDLPNDRPGFSTDATTIYYMKRQQDLVVRNLQSGGEHILYTTDVPHALRNPNVELSPDGRRLVFQLQEVPSGYDSVAVMPATGGEPKVLLSIPHPERILGRALIWTADSRNILMSRGRGDRSSVWRISAEGGQAQEIGLSMPGLVRMLRLHPDGRHLAFLNGEIRDEIWAIEDPVSAVHSK